jgi:hypothetical protein
MPEVWDSTVTPPVEKSTKPTRSAVGLATAQHGSLPLGLALCGTGPGDNVELDRRHVDELNFDNEVIDTDNGHSITTNSSRYTVPIAGWCRASGCIVWLLIERKGIRAFVEFVTMVTVCWGSSSMN